MDAFRDECGLFGITGHRRAAHLAWSALHHLNHRGGSGCGLVMSDGHLLQSKHGGVDVEALFGGIPPTAGHLAVAQVYGGGPSSHDRPMMARYQGGQLGLAIAGRFTNGPRLRRKLKGDGHLFTSLSDNEILLQLIAASAQKTLVNRVVDALFQIEGAFSLLLASEDRLIAVRDPRGFRPLLMGRVGAAGAIAFCTEDGPIRAVGGTVIREVKPGEMVIVDGGALLSVNPFGAQPPARCVHEFVRLASPAARSMGQDVYPVRVALGERLAKEQPCDVADVVIGLPGDGVPVALGYARASRVDYFQGLLPLQSSRGPDELGDGEQRARSPWTAVDSVVAEKRVVLVLSSLVKGQEALDAIRPLHAAGAVEVHLRIASPPVRHGCRYGVGSPTDEELASRRIDSISALAEELNTASLGYLSLDGLQDIVGRRVDGSRTHCLGCFDGKWPLVSEEPAEDQLALFSEGPTTHGSAIKGS